VFCDNNVAFVITFFEAVEERAARSSIGRYQKTCLAPRSATKPGT
jgi:hypothetical protein